jgi:transcription initiation factor TFIIE subunit alpha
MLSFIDDETMMKVVGLLGEEAVKIIEALKDVEETTDEEIAAKTTIRLNDVRKILYRMYEHSLISLRQTRDKNTGWFIFHWRLQPDQFEGFILNQKRRVLEKLEARLEYEKNHEFYYCYTQGCRKIPFEEAVELVFRCPACNKPMGHFENGQIIKTLTEKVEQLRKELSE